MGAVLRELGRMLSGSSTTWRNLLLLDQGGSHHLTPRSTKDIRRRAEGGRPPMPCLLVPSLSHLPSGLDGPSLDVVPETHGRSRAAIAALCAGKVRTARPPLSTPTLLPWDLDEDVNMRASSPHTSVRFRGLDVKLRFGNEAVESRISLPLPSLPLRNAHTNQGDFNKRCRALKSTYA